jgi:hypothetical protein
MRKHWILLIEVIVTIGFISVWVIIPLDSPAWIRAFLLFGSCFSAALVALDIQTIREGQKNKKK